MKIFAATLRAVVSAPGGTLSGTSTPLVVPMMSDVNARPETQMFSRLTMVDADSDLT
jgi:hypothetical protein